DPNNHFNGHSLVIDPLGNIVAHGGEDEGNIYAEIDLNLVAETRGIIPVFTDRRPELY
ncbi:nitrilase-related carbon-nitrogen hydrolase, partial [Listeria monocytogenes]